MTDEELKRVFLPFTQADSSTTRRYGGTGLGLFISRRFCHMMGGELTCTSRPGIGSTFTVHVPTSVVDGDESRQESEFEFETVAYMHSGAKRVLVIDDDPLVRDLLRRFLEGEGYVVVTASDGVEGLRLAEEVLSLIHISEPTRPY